MKVITVPYKDAKFDYEPFELKAAAAVPQTEITEEVGEDNSDNKSEQAENAEQKPEASGEKAPAPTAPAPQPTKYEYITEPVRLTPAEPDKSYSENLSKEKAQAGSAQMGRFF